LLKTIVFGVGSHVLTCWYLLERWRVNAIGFNVFGMDLVIIGLYFCWIASNSLVYQLRINIINEGMALILKLLLSSVLTWLCAYFSLKTELILNGFVLTVLSLYINRANFYIVL